MSDRRELGALAALAFIARMVVALAIPAAPVWDGELYHRGAQSIASGLGYSCFMFGPAADPRVPTAYYPVGLPAYLAAFYAVLGAKPLARALAGSLAGAVMTAASHRLGERVGGAWAARAAAIIVALYPGLLLSAPTPMTETLWGTLLALAVALLAHPSLDTRRLTMLGLALAAAAYVRPQALVLAPLLPLIPKGDARLRLRRALIVCAVVAACIAPWTLRNRVALGSWSAVSTNGAGNLAIGAVPRADGRYLALTAADGCGGVVGEAARERCWRAVVRRSIARDPGRWIALAAPKVWHTWGYEAFPAGYLAAARPDLVDPQREARLRDVLTALWRALVIGAVLALVVRRRELGVAGALCVATLAAVTLTHAVFFGGDRYHLPLVPLVATIAASIAGAELRQGPFARRSSSDVTQSDAPRGG